MCYKICFLKPGGREVCLINRLRNYCQRQATAIYRLVRLASMRATELAATGVKLIQVPADQKLATTALDEIRVGRVIEKDENEKEERIRKNAKS